MSDDTIWDRLPLSQDAPSHMDPNSLEAAVEAARHRVGLQREILEWIRSHGPRSSSQLEGALHRKHQSVSSAIKGMRDLGILCRVGKRKNAGGRSEWVYDIRPHVRRGLGLDPGEPEWAGGPDRWFP